MPILPNIKADLRRYNMSFLRAYLLIPGFKYMFYFRLASLLFPLCLPFKLKLLLMQHKYGIQIPWNTSIGKGFYIGHYGTIIVNCYSKIGVNVNISHGVTIGQSSRGKNEGYPTIGDRVYIGPGAKIIGNIKVGNDVAIGANAVVTKDVPDGACVAGVPAKIISMEGSKGYVINLC